MNRGSRGVTGFGADRGPSPQATKIALGAAGAVVLVLALGFFYLTAWRSFAVTVNGQEQTVRVGTSVADFLKDNDYFGVKAGRLLSVSGKVIDEQGGDRCEVSMGDKAVAKKDFDATEVLEGSKLTVKDGKDATEPHKEEKTAVAPKAEMEVGGAIQYVKQWGEAGEKAVWKGEKSGETVDKGVTKEPKNFVIGSRTPKPKGDKKYMALTFDDGPSQYTGKILDILKEKGVKATFYNLGENSGEYPELTKRLVDEGHELASHTNKHQNLPTLNKKGLRNEISSAFKTLEKNSGEQDVQMIRAPYGAFTKTEWLRASDIISCNVLWNIDTLDWKLPGADVIRDTVLDQAGNGYIALMHDGGGNREQDIKALPGIIDGLREKGYELVTVGELMRLDGTFPEEVVNGTVKQPKGAVVPEA